MLPKSALILPLLLLGCAQEKPAELVVCSSNPKTGKMVCAVTSAPNMRICHGAMEKAKEEYQSDPRLTTWWTCRLPVGREL